MSKTNLFFQTKKSLVQISAESEGCIIQLDCSIPHITSSSRSFETTERSASDSLSFNEACYFTIHVKNESNHNTWRQYTVSLLMPPLLMRNKMNY